MAINFPSNGTLTSAYTASGGSYLTTSTGLYSGISYVHTFVSPGVFSVTNTTIVSYLVLAGGGAGGASGRNNPSPTGGGRGGGGGAGQLVTGTFTATAGLTYTVQVGTGGSGGAGTGCIGNFSQIYNCTPPGNLQIFASGGGGGQAAAGAPTTPAKLNGGSGGGGTLSTPSYGGSGAGGTGIVPSSPQIGVISYFNYGTAGQTAGSGGGASGTGPSGLPYNISGAAVTYGTGGTGGGNLPTGDYNGSSASGYGNGGGGASSSFGTTSYTGGSGSPGIVILSYGPSSVSIPLQNGQVLSIGSTATNTFETWIYSTAQGRWVSNTGTTTTFNISIVGISCQANTGTGAIALPAGTTAQRVIPTRSGAMRYNTDTGMVEAYYTTTGWVVDLGSTQTTYVAQYLGVAGGGGAGGSYPPTGSYGGGNGGVGGIAQGFITLYAGVSYAVTVGTNGSGGPGGLTNNNPSGGAGGASYMSGPATVGYYFYATGGGGGPGAPGAFGPKPAATPGSAPVGGSPSPGVLNITSSVTGSPYSYGGCGSGSGVYGASGAISPTNGGAGGAGIVYIKYPGSQRATGGNSITTVGTFTLHTFTSPGTFSA